MAEAGRFTPQKTNQNGEAPPDAQSAKQEKDDAGKPALKVTFERQGSREAFKPADTSADKAAAHVTLVPEPAPANSYRGDVAAGKDAKDAKSEDTKAGKAIPPAATTGSSSTALSNTPAAAREIPTTAQLVTTPLLAIVAALSLLAAGWSYAKLRETDAQLTVATEALSTAATERAAAVKAKLVAEKALADASVEKTSVAQAKISAEKALSDAQTRLATVEKTIADVKAALATLVTNAAPAGGTASKPAAPAAKDAAPAK